MNSLITIFLALFVVSIANAKRVLIISDIDDTIKVSHILSTAGKVSRASDVTTPFTGMAQLYQLLVNENSQDTRVVYLSNAPKEIAGIPALEFSHRTFLSFNNFPPGEVDLRESIFEKNHKINEIRRMIEVEKPEILILIGDNGERDPEIYHQAYLEFSNQVRIVSFIHQMYSNHVPFYKPNFLAEIGTLITKEQVGFVTPIEIAVELKKQNLLSQKSYNWMIENVVPYILQEGSFKWDGLKPISFPAFKNCSDFVWRWKITPELSPIYDKIKKACR
ncbi:MAG: phosphatase domain-containing protein [Pseudobdellovibrio sp.]